MSVIRGLSSILQESSITEGQKKLIELIEYYLPAIKFKGSSRADAAKFISNNKEAAVRVSHYFKEMREEWEQGDWLYAHED